MDSPEMRDLIGIPFVDGGRDPAVGLDCWGLFRLAMTRFGHCVPDFDVSCFDTPEIAATAAVEAISGPWERISSPEPGCAVLMSLDPDLPGLIQHFGVYIGEGRFIHTLKKTRASLASVHHPFWSGKIKGYYRWTR